MANSELRKMSRRALIELLYKQKKKEEALKEQIEQLQMQLSERKLTIQKAGTLAEAVVSINGVMDAAQKAADQYLAEVHETYANTEKACEKMLSQTKEDCKRREEETELKISAKWEEFDRLVKDYLQTHSELEVLQEN